MAPDTNYTWERNGWQWRSNRRTLSQALLRRAAQSRSITQRLKGAEQAGDSRALAQFAEQRAGRIGVGLARIRGIGPNRVVDNLCRFFQVDVQGGFAYIHAVLDAVVTQLAYRCRLGAFSVMFSQIANGGTTGDFCMRCEKLRLELFEESLPFLLDGSGVGQGLGRGLHFRSGRNNIGRNSLFAVASRADVQVGGIIEAAVGTRHSVAGGLVQPLDVTNGVAKIAPHFSATFGSSIALGQNGLCRFSACGLRGSRDVHLSISLKNPVFQSK